jgi:hypothetical protein
LSPKREGGFWVKANNCSLKRQIEKADKQRDGNNSFGKSPSRKGKQPMTAKVLEIVILGGAAALLFWFSYAIGVKKRLGLIAGYNGRSAHQVSDKDGLARLIGRLCFLVGCAAALMPFATGIWGVSRSGVWGCIGGFIGFLAGVVAFTALQAREYTLRPSIRKSP